MNEQPILHHAEEEMLPLPAHSSLLTDVVMSLGHLPSYQDLGLLHTL